MAFDKQTGCLDMVNSLLSPESRSKITNHELSSDIDIFFSFLKQFLFKYCSNECQKLLESFNKKERKLLGRQARNFRNNYFQKDNLIS